VTEAPLSFLGDYNNTLQHTDKHSLSKDKNTYQHTYVHTRMLSLSLSLSFLLAPISEANTYRFASVSDWVFPLSVIFLFFS